LYNVLAEYKVEDFLDRLVNGELSELDSLNSGNEEDETRSEICGKLEIKCWVFLIISVVFFQFNVLYVGSKWNAYKLKSKNT